MSKKNSKAFSLIELLVTITIIGVIMAIGVAAYTRAQKRGRDARRTADIKAVQAALELYYSENSKYPSASSYITSAPSGLVTGFMKEYPVDPSSFPYYYQSTDGSCYCVAARVEATTPKESTPGCTDPEASPNNNIVFTCP